MATNPVYVPMLKGKEGEYGALEGLASNVKQQIMPLIEIPTVPFDYSNDRPAKTLDEHVEGIAERIYRCWRNAPLYLDMPFVGDQELLKDGRVSFEAVLSDCANQGVAAVPVVSRSSPKAFLAAASRYSTEVGMPACVRLFVEDFEENIDIDAELRRILTELAIESESVDLIADLEMLGSEVTRTLIARSVLSMIPDKQRWRRMILAATSFPEDLSDVDASTITTLPRHEWALWKTLQRRPAALERRDMIYGDYTIAHPVPREIDPRTMRMSANIRYTAKDTWLIVKGRNVRQYGFDQYFELCKTLTARPEYQGPQFSWGDKYIQDCADGLSGPGNATTWRKVGTNHHLTLVVRELSSLPRDV